VIYGTCSICGSAGRLARGWCSAHYHRWCRYGDPLGVPEPALPVPDLPGERWLPVTGYEGLYGVSNMGRVRSFWAGRGTGKRGGLLKPGMGSTGHLTVALSHPDKPTRSWPVHQIVAQAFIGPCPVGQEVRHGPNGALDNRASQLCYGTRKQNSDDRLRDGTDQRGEQLTFAKLTEAIIAECKRRYGAGETQTALAAEFGVSTSVMSEAVNGKSWAHLADPADVVRPRTWLTGEKHSQAKLTWGSVAEIRRRYAAGEMQRPLGAEFGVSQAVVSSIVRGKTWKLPA
jgi:hypothetical protein